jgi:hypothetical protein
MFGNWYGVKKLVAGLTWLLSTTSLSEVTHIWEQNSHKAHSCMSSLILYTSVENAPEIHYTLQSSSCGSKHSAWKPKMTDTMKLFLHL